MERRRPALWPPAAPLLRDLTGIGRGLYRRVGCDLCSDALVIGGGVIGAATAYYLAREGCRVTVLERQGISGGASGANMGLIAVSTKPPGPLFELARTSAGMFPTLAEELGQEIHYQRTGVLHVLTEPAMAAAARIKVGQMRQTGIDARLLDARETREREPALSPAVLGSIWADTDGTVYPFALTMGYAHAAARLGAQILSGPQAEVLAIRVDRGRVVGVETPGGFHPAPTVVLATGAWAALLPAGLGLNIPVVPVRGHMLVTERAPRLIRHVVFGGEPSASQSHFGNILIGSTLEYVGFRQDVELSTLSAFAHGVLQLFPGLAALAVIRSWTGLRPATDDGMPIIGRVPGVEGLFLHVGHFRNGVGYAPASARIAADLITRGTTWPWAQAFSPLRFGSALMNRPDGQLVSPDKQPR